MEKTKLLKELSNEIKDKLRHRGTNYAIIFFGIIVGILVFLVYFNKTISPDFPPYIVNTLKILMLVFGAYLIAALLIRITIDFIIRVLAKEFEIERKLLIKKLYAGLIYLIATLYIMWRLGFGLQNMTIVAGLITTGIAFAVRDIIMSYLSWYILLTKKPFRIGDYIKIGDEEGKVMHIGTFFVLIDNSPNTIDDFVRIPNRLFLEKPIQNFGQNNVLHTVKFYINEIPKNYDTKIEKIIKKINSELKIDVKAFLDYEQDKRFIRYEFRDDYSRKAELRDRIIRITAKML